MKVSYYKSPIGLIRVHYTDTLGLQGLRFIDEDFPVTGPVDEFSMDLFKQLDRYFSGEEVQFSLNISPEGTDFQQEIWRLLQEIPYRKTYSYRELSERYGDVNAIRAIASANAANPIAIIIPCHRVIGSDGSLTGYAGGLWRKEYLLDKERGVNRLFDL